jgi:hypothetical protein
MSFMSRILGLIRLPESMWVEGRYLALKMRVAERHPRLAGASPKGRWFSALEEKQFRSAQLERTAYIESVTRLVVAR